jgi:3-hydroxy-9,10-secoandrosta-1,3,5(10)-triene-9,17-dione monooxygenase
MDNVATAEQAGSAQALVEVVGGLSPRFRERAAEGEAERTLPPASAAEMIEAQLPSVLVPKRWGGFELDLHTWLDLVIETSKADASHGWCANLMIHHPQMLAAFPEDAQAALWGETPNVVIAGVVRPSCEVRKVADGYRISGNSPFASGVAQSSWVYLAGLVEDEEGGRRSMLFLVPTEDCAVVDTWRTTGMCATGSNTIVTDDVFVPSERSLAFSEIVNGTAAGARIHDNPIYRLPFASYAQAGFAAAMLGAARGACEEFRDQALARKQPDGTRVADGSAVRVQLGRAAADLDAAELLLRRVIDVAETGPPPTLEMRARALRDCARAAELITDVIEGITRMGGTSGFSSSSPLQRFWRDIHFASCHVSLNVEGNLGYWGGLEVGAERPPRMAVY